MHNSSGQFPRIAILAAAVGAQLLVAGPAAAELYKVRDSTGRIILCNTPVGRAVQTVSGSTLRVRSSQPAAPKPVERSTHRDHIESAARAQDLSPELIEAVIHVESADNPRAVSKKGAQGLMQLMPATSRYLGVDDPFDPEQNIAGGARYLRELLDEFGDMSLMLAAYNAGPERVRTAGGIPRIDETRQYVRKVRSVLEDIAPATTVAELFPRVSASSLQAEGDRVGARGAAKVRAYRDQRGIFHLTNVPNF